MILDERMTPQEAALYLNYKPKTLAIWRSKGIGPKYVKPRGRVFYLKNSLDDWLKSAGEFQSTGQEEEIKRRFAAR